MSETANFKANRLNGLKLARYVLNKLHEENFNFRSLSEELDGNEKFVGPILDFLKEVNWISEDANGIYRLTSEGHRNCLDNLKF